MDTLSVCRFESETQIYSVRNLPQSVYFSSSVFTYGTTSSGGGRSRAGQHVGVRVPPSAASWDLRRPPCSHGSTASPSSSSLLHQPPSSGLHRICNRPVRFSSSFFCEETVSFSNLFDPLQSHRPPVQPTLLSPEVNAATPSLGEAVREYMGLHSKYYGRIMVFFLALTGYNVVDQRMRRQHKKKAMDGSTIDTFGSSCP